MDYSDTAGIGSNYQFQLANPLKYLICHWFDGYWLPRITWCNMRLLGPRRTTKTMMMMMMMRALVVVAVGGDRWVTMDQPIDWLGANRVPKNWLYNCAAQRSISFFFPSSLFIIIIFFSFWFSLLLIFLMVKKGSKLKTERQIGTERHCQ